MEPGGLETVSRCDMHPYQVRKRDFYYDICSHDIGLFFIGKGEIEMTMYYNADKERQEAIGAGERALTSLKDAEHYLGGARLWGIVDLFGGGGLSGLLKHSKLQDASRSLERAKADLYSFQKELRDVRSLGGLDIDIGGFLTFADFFFDGLIADYLVQSKINTARRQVAEAISQTEEILDSLRRM